MPRSPTKGTCLLCDRTYSKAAMARHLEQWCIQDKAASGRRPLGPQGQGGRLFHLAVEAFYLPSYWLHVEAKADATLEELDAFLRRIWVECCGHWSVFQIAGRTYSASPSVDLADQGINIALADVLRPGSGFAYEYDICEPTDLFLEVVSEREGELVGKPIELLGNPLAAPTRLLARNDPPVMPCDSCGAPATQVCSERRNAAARWLCDACAPEDEWGDDIFLPIVNSPRTGVCAYMGSEPAQRGDGMPPLC